MDKFDKCIMDKCDKCNLLYVVIHIIGFISTGIYTLIQTQTYSTIDLGEGFFIGFLSIHGLYNIGLFSGINREMRDPKNSDYDKRMDCCKDCDCCYRWDRWFLGFFIIGNLFFTIFLNSHEFAENEEGKSFHEGYYTTFVVIFVLSVLNTFYTGYLDYKVIKNIRWNNTDRIDPGDGDYPGVRIDTNDQTGQYKNLRY